MENINNRLHVSKLYKIGICIIILLLFQTTAWTCGFGYEPERTFSFFDQRIIHQPQFNHIFNIHPYYEDSGMPGKKMYLDEKEIMIGEWQTFFKEIGYTEDAETLLFKTEPQKIKTTLSKFKAANQKVYRDIYTYILFTHEVKEYVEPIKDKWGIDTPPEMDPSRMEPLRNKAASRASDLSIHKFLRSRYGFQAVRLSVLIMEPEKGWRYYNKYVAPMNTGLLRYWALGYLAMMEEKRSDALGIYLDIYDQCPPMTDKMKRSISEPYFTQQTWDDMMEKTPSPHKKATALFVRSILQKRDYSLETLEEMIKLEPRSIRQEALLVRFIHTIEKYNFKEDSKYFFEEKGPGNRYDDLIALCTNEGDGKKAKQPALWYTAGAYLSLLQGDTARTEQLLKKAKQEKTDNPFLTRQIHLTETLLSLQKISISPQPQEIENLKTRLADDLQWFGGISKPSIPASYNRLVARSILFLAGNWFFLKNDPVRYSMCIFAGTYAMKERYKPQEKNDIDSLSNDSQLEILEKIMSSPDKNPMDSWLIDNFATNDPNDIIFLRAIKWMRLEEYGKAMEQFSRLSTDYWNQIDQNEYYKSGKIPGAYVPFYDEELPYLRYNKIKISRNNCDFDEKPTWEVVPVKEYCKILQGLQERAKQLENDPAALSQVYYTLGNLVYNLKTIGYPGISRYFGRRREYPIEPYYRTNNPELNYKQIDEAIQKKKEETLKETDNFLKAEKYYTRIVELDADRELAAKCCILINACRNIFLYTRCLEDKYFNFHFPNISRDFKLSPDFTKHKEELKYFYLLVQKYKDTEYFSNQVKQCPILEVFK